VPNLFHVVFHGRMSVQFKVYSINNGVKLLIVTFPCRWDSFLLNSGTLPNSWSFEVQSHLEWRRLRISTGLADSCCGFDLNSWYVCLSKNVLLDHTLMASAVPIIDVKSNRGKQPGYRELCAVTSHKDRFTGEPVVSEAKAAPGPGVVNHQYLKPSG
jgi:hypothetical protein